MSLQGTLGKAMRTVDRKFGLLAWLSGEPRPPRGGFDLEGEKFVDWGWICTRLPRTPGKALEIGSGKSPIVPALISLGYDVTAVDLCADISSLYDGVQFVLGDFTHVGFHSRFDVIVLCSVVEHIGLSGRYNSSEDPDGDLTVMKTAIKLLTRGGSLFLTIPVGKDATHRPWHRVYGDQRLKLLLTGFTVQACRFLVKRPHGPWCISSRECALSVEPDPRRYALGQFILQSTGVVEDAASS